MNFVCFLHIEKNFPAMVRKCLVRKCQSANARPHMSIRKSRSANARPQKSVRKCPSAKVSPQLPVRKSRSANARPQLSDPQMPVRKCCSANDGPQLSQHRLNHVNKIVSRFSESKLDFHKCVNRLM